MNREAARASLLKVHEPLRKTVTAFGVTFDLLQPPLGEFLQAQSLSADANGVGLVDPVPADGVATGDADAADESGMALKLLVQYAVVEGTNERLFTEEDLPQIKQWPYTAEFTTIQQAIVELAGLDLETAKADLANPTSVR